MFTATPTAREVATWLITAETKVSAEECILSSPFLYVGVILGLPPASVSDLALEVISPLANSNHVQPNQVSSSPFYSPLTIISPPIIFPAHTTMMQLPLCWKGRAGRQSLSHLSVQSNWFSTRIFDIILPSSAPPRPSDPLFGVSFKTNERTSNQGHMSIRSPSSYTYPPQTDYKFRYHILVCAALMPRSQGSPS